MSRGSLVNIVYQLSDDIKSKLSTCSSDNASVLTDDTPEKTDRKSRIFQILKDHNLHSCRFSLLSSISNKDCEGFIYAYYSKSKPGIFKVGRSKNLPFRRIINQERNNNEKYRNKESFHCCFHHLVEACVHIELKSHRLKLEKKQDGYTEWFRIEWGALREKIKNVISAIMELFINDLLLFNCDDEWCN